MRLPTPRRTSEPDTWVRRTGAAAVATVAAYASYVHQREFARQGGADPLSAALWPLSVDGLLLLATAGLLRRPREGERRARWALWLAFLLGIAVSLAANIAAAPALAWKPVLVAGWPPVALLLAVELLIPRRRSDDAARADVVAGQKEQGTVAGDEKDADDPLLARARQVDAKHWDLYRRPVSAESLRKELRVGAERSRQLVALLRTGGRHGQQSRKSSNATKHQKAPQS
ncbi:DUF2637 domain-containing protein [Streptomyces longispororuber]|uniref:DUF2637 domain-containing protein n=1 Tax=Streptomyces longispororuber TaxID=68230 RepID=UPI0036FB2474